MHPYSFQAPEPLASTNPQRLCSHCRTNPVPPDRSRYCSHDCLTAAARENSRLLKRSYRKNGDLRSDDHWDKVGFNKKRAYFAAYMRRYRAKKMCPQRGVIGGVMTTGKESANA